VKVTPFRKRIAAFASLTLAMEIILYPETVSGEMTMLVASTASSMSSSLIIVYAISRMQRYRDDSELDNEVSNAFSSAFFYNSTGIPLSRSLRLSSDNLNRRAAAPFVNLANRLSLGQQFNEAFKSVKALSSSRAFAAGVKNIGAEVPRLVSLLAMRELALKSKLSGIESSMQRYSTMSMFVAVILPSFVLFSFIGSSVLFNSYAGAALIYPVLVCFLPAAYALSSLLISRGLNG
jgi:hypothetical protein